jgi:hypothetical protein
MGLGASLQMTPADLAVLLLTGPAALSAARLLLKHIEFADFVTLLVRSCGSCRLGTVQHRSGLLHLFCRQLLGVGLNCCVCSSMLPPADRKSLKYMTRTTGECSSSKPQCSRLLMAQDFFWHKCRSGDFYGLNSYPVGRK